MTTTTTNRKRGETVSMDKDDNRSSKKINVRKLTLIALFSSLAGVVMLFEFPLPIAPPFYKIDLSEIIVLIGTFSLGPLSGVVIELMKNAVKLIIKGTSTAFVGEIANFTVGCVFILPAGIIYRYYRSKKSALVGLIVGTLSLTVVASLANWFILLPAYSKLYGLPIEAFIAMGSEINDSIKDLPTFIVLATMPFNLVKGVISSLVTFLVYKRLSPLIKKAAADGDVHVLNSGDTGLSE
jgi:riboflavin transporter FmnP